MPEFTRDQARVWLHNNESHLETTTALAVGDTLEVIRGNGPREGERMGTATVTGFEDGIPNLSIRLDATGTELRSEGGEVTPD